MITPSHQSNIPTSEQERDTPWTTELKRFGHSIPKRAWMIFAILAAGGYVAGVLLALILR